MTGYIGNIDKITMTNENFRRVLYTSQQTQLAVMCLQIGEDIGIEIHEDIDQFFRIETGEGKVVLEGEEHAVAKGDVILVPGGVKHNIINTSSDKKLKLHTLYVPPHHKNNLIHKTKQEAVSDTTDYPA